MERFLAAKGASAPKWLNGLIQAKTDIPWETLFHSGETRPGSSEALRTPRLPETGSLSCCSSSRVAHGDATHLIEPETFVEEGLRPASYALGFAK